MKMAKKEPVFITKNGKIEAVMEAISDDDIEDYLLERSPRFRLLLKHSAAKEGGMSLSAYRRSRKM
ncbi:MAG: hypothetical protein HYU99_05095 [Deltaproteobacteria bacterium]|nr:hypothetical protein [Deltaproteobacteria bacterium]